MLHERTLGLVIYVWLTLIFLVSYLRITLYSISFSIVSIKANFYYNFCFDVFYINLMPIKKTEQNKKNNKLINHY